MGIIKNILAILGIIGIIVGFYVAFKPENTKELDDLHRQNDSLFNQITINNKKIDSLQIVNNKLDSQRNVLKSQLGVVSVKADKFKKQHEEDIKHLNSLSDNDITDLFADKFTEIE